jgi:hypothetical protein
MNYKKVLEKLGFIEGKDFSLTETSFVMLEQSKIVHSFIHHPAVEATYDLEGSELTPYIPAYDEPEFIIHPEVPAVLDQEGNEVTPAMPEWSEPKMVEEFFTLPAPLESVMQETWKQVQISELDVAMLINKYLSDKRHLITKDDCVNISEGILVGWDFKDVPKPSIDTLFSLNDILIEEQIIENTIENKINEGADMEKDCVRCLQFITGYNNDRLTEVQLTLMAQKLSGVSAALQNRMPKKAKTLLLDISVDGTIITQELKDGCLFILNKYAII